MSGSTIGIKIADGSYYPILEQGFTGRKKLTLTTVADSQTRVQIDLYRGDGGGLAKARYIGSLIIENIPPAPRGEPEIHLSIGLDADGELEAEASDAGTGETQTFSISLKTLADEETYEVPEFHVEEGPQERAADDLLGPEGDEGELPARAAAEDEATFEFPVDEAGDTAEVELDGLEGAGEAEPVAEPGQPVQAAGAGQAGGREPFDFEGPPLTGESYPTGGPARMRGRRQEGGRRRGPGTFLIVLFCLLGALLLGVVGYVVYRAATGQPVQLLSPAAAPQPAGTPAPAAPAAAEGTGQAGEQATGQAAGQAAAPTAPAAEQGAGGVSAAPADRKPAAPRGVTYRIRKGDTLWDISATYYRNPWLYLRLARANSIKNPDLILAGAKLFIPED